MNFFKRLPQPRAGALLALAALLLAFAACQLVAGVQSRELDPIASGCALPTGNGPQVRFANFAPNGDALDLCIRSSGASWGEPLILNGGSACGSKFPSTGFTYGQVTVSFTAPGSTIDVKTVLGGGTCNSSAIAEIDKVTVQGAPAVTTLIAIGGANSLPKKLVALRETGQTNGGNGGQFRFVNTLTGYPSIDVGAAQTDSLPSTLSITYNLSGGIASGGTLPSTAKVALGTVDPNGYLSLLGAEYQLA